MLNTSNAYKSKILESDRKFTVLAWFLFPDGVQLTLTDSDFMEGGIQLEDGTSSPGKLEVGCASIGKLTLLLNNYTERFDFRAFYDAEIRLSVGLVLDDHTEWLQKGVYIVDESVSDGPVVKLIAYDYMDKFDRPYSDSQLQYPATLSAIVRDCCTRRGVTLGTDRFSNYDYLVESRPEDESITDREMLSYVAQLAGCFARIDNHGSLLLDWYEMDRFCVEDNLDGGDNWVLTNSADGNIEQYDGGLFRAPYFGPASIERVSNLQIATDDIVVTGVKINADDNTWFYGQDGYVVVITDNPLIQNNPEPVLLVLAKRLVGLKYRPLTVTGMSDPSIEASDVMWVTDQKGTRHRAIISNLTYSVDGSTEYASDAETPSSNKSIRATAVTKIEQSTKKIIDYQLSNYDLEVRQLNNLMANALGFYQTSVTNEDGSRVDYMHDKPTLDQSKIVWKKNIDGFAVSNDGGQTYDYGVTSGGNAVVKVLSAIGINADWINVGTLVSPKNPRVYFKLDDGEMASSKLVSSDTESTDVYMQIGTVNWSDGSKSKGVDMMSKDGLFARFNCLEADTPGLGLLTSGELVIRSNAHVNSDDNTIKLYNQPNKKGCFEVWVSQANGKDENTIRSAPDGVWISRTFASTNRSYMRMASGIIEFGVGQYAQASIEDGKAKFGDIYTNGVLVTSDRDKKTNIRPSNVDALQLIGELNFYSYALKVPDPTVRMATITGYDDDASYCTAPPFVASKEQVSIGIMYDEAPDAIKSYNEKAIDLYSYVGLTAKAIQELKDQVDILKTELIQLKERVLNGNTNAARE